MPERVRIDFRKTKEWIDLSWLKEGEAFQAKRKAQNTLEARMQQNTKKGDIT